jgi:hypothetical protein
MRGWEIAARENIRVLVARYNGLGDRGQAADLSHLFAPDGVLEIHGGKSHTGPQAIEAFLSTVASDNTSGGTYWRHYVATHNVEVTSRSEGAGTAYFQVIDNQGLNHWGRYRDRYRKGPTGQWLFAHRLVRVDGYAAHAQPTAVAENS